jgi:ubiquitin thioesterase OTU1
VGFLFYNGLHYDPLAGAAAPHPRTFPREGPEQAAAAAGAQALAATARAAGTYTDLAGFTLRCSECGVGVTGQAGAVRHAQDSTHNSFFEYREAPVQVA